MKIEFLADSEKGPGYGILRFSEFLAPDGPWDISFQRGSDQLFLTESGKWTGNASFFSAPGKANGSGLELYFGPEVVDTLDQRETYRITLKGEDGAEHAGRLTAPRVIYSQTQNLGNTVRPEERSPRTTPPPQSPPESRLEQQPRPQPAPEPIPVPEPPVEPASEPLPLAEPVAKKSGWWKYVVLAVLVLVCGLWYFLDQDHNGGEPKAPVGVQESPGSRSVSEKVNAFFASSSKTPQGAMSLFDSLDLKTARDKDAAYRLLYYSAVEGDKSALLRYGQCLDPSLPNWGSIEKDPALALNAYKEAADNPEARENMERLQKWMSEHKAP